MTAWIVILFFRRPNSLQSQKSFAVGEPPSSSRLSFPVSRAVLTLLRSLWRATDGQAETALQ